MKTLILIVLVIALIATGGLAWDLSAALGLARQASLTRALQAAPLCAPCRCDYPPPTACLTAAAPEEAAPAQPPIPPSLVLRLARQGRDCTLTGEPNLTIMKGD